MATQTQIVPLQESQQKIAGEVLARAFFDDPLSEYLLPDEEKRRKVLPWFFGKGAKYGHMFGEVYTTPDSVDGAAIWLPPEDFVMTPYRMLRSGMLAAPFKFGLSTFMRFMGAMNHVEELHKRDVSPKHWYLFILGVDPDRQGQGVGGQLIQPVVTRADAQGLPCYLETMKTRNVPFYRKHGFEVVVEADLPKGGPHFWTMKREPRG
ncbi:MAG: GNAT family N-acetyltransferase [Dehalococcoidia bacterium]